MIRETVRGASCVSSVIREVADGLEQGQVRVGDEKFHVGPNVVAVAEADPATGDVLIVVTGCSPLTHDPAVATRSTTSWPTPMIDTEDGSNRMEACSFQARMPRSSTSITPERRRRPRSLERPDERRVMHAVD
jgi:hypothetical protein